MDLASRPSQEAVRVDTSPKSTHSEGFEVPCSDPLLQHGLVQRLRCHGPVRSDSCKGFEVSQSGPLRLLQLDSGFMDVSPVFFVLPNPRPQESG